MGAPLLDLAALAENIEPGPDGVWVSRSRTEISYPEEGNFNCLALEADSFWFAHRNRCIQAVMRRFPPGGMVFDVGGGNGYVALGLQQAGIPVALLEPGWQGVWNARQRGVETLICSTLEDAGFRPGSLPAVGAFDVLEHIHDDEGFLRSIYDRLVPGGRLYLTTPAYPALWSADDEYAGHHRRYTLPALRRKLEKAGFQVNFASYFFFLLPLPIFLFRTFPTRFGWLKQGSWERYEDEHCGWPGRAGRVLDRILHWELAWLQSGRKVPVGGSCLVAAQKPRFENRV